MNARPRPSRPGKSTPALRACSLHPVHLASRSARVPPARRVAGQVWELCRYRPERVDPAEDQRRGRAGSALRGRRRAADVAGQRSQIRSHGKRKGRPLDPRLQHRPFPQS